MASHDDHAVYLDIGFSKTEIGSVVKLFGFWATVTGGLIGGLLITPGHLSLALADFGILRGFRRRASPYWHLIGRCKRARTGSRDHYRTCRAAWAPAAYVAYMAGLTNGEFTATLWVRPVVEPDGGAAGLLPRADRLPSPVRWDGRGFRRLCVARTRVAAVRWLHGRGSDAATAGGLMGSIDLLSAFVVGLLGGVQYRGCAAASSVLCLSVCRPRPRAGPSCWPQRRADQQLHAGRRDNGCARVSISPGLLPVQTAQRFLLSLAGLFLILMGLYLAGWWSALTHPEGRRRAVAENRATPRAVCCRSAVGTAELSSGPAVGLAAVGWYTAHWYGQLSAGGARR